MLLLNILIPMAGAGSRFKSQGYMIHKPILPIYSRHEKQNIPMVVEAVKDLPVDVNAEENKIFFIMRDFHFKSNVHKKIELFFSNANFIKVDTLTEGQASTCLLAENLVENEQQFLISACDNGIDVDTLKFQNVSDNADAIIFVFSQNPTVLKHPEAFGWVEANEDSVAKVSIKKPVSNNPISDYAIVGTFWFKKASYFFEAAREMISEEDKINGEYYVDQVFKYLIASDYNIKVLEVDKYFSWGTPVDYEDYQKNILQKV